MERRPLREPAGDGYDHPRWSRWFWALIIPVDTLVIGYIMYMIQSGAWTT